MDNYTKYDRGSEWRKWDLHIHTPASFHWKGSKKIRQMVKEEKNTELLNFINEINKSDVAAFCLMDYWTFDWYIELQDYLKVKTDVLKKTIFPGIELRIECPVDYRLNIHCILSDKLSKQELLDFKSELYIRSIDKKLSDDSLISFARSLDDSKARKHGFNPPNTLNDDELLQLASETAEITKDSLNKAFKQIPSYSGFIILPYDTSDGLLKLNWEDHPHDDNYFMQSADIFETRDHDNIDLISGNKTPTNKKYFENFFKTLGNKAKPCISGSDAHRYSDYGCYPSDKITWIKADPTFEGLKQIIYEPKLRVRIQPNLPEEKSGYLVIDRIEIDSTHIYNKQLMFNPNLNCIIGGRSTGKSILLAAIAKKLKTERSIEFEEADYEKFVAEVSNSLKILWKDDEERNDREIEYFKQGYMYDLARKEKKRSELIKNILLQKEKEVYINVHDNFIFENKKRIQDLVIDFFKIISDINDKEQKCRDKGDKKGIEDEIARLNDDLTRLSSTGISDEEKVIYEKHKGIIEKATQQEITIKNDILNIEALKNVSLFKESISYELTSISDTRKKFVEDFFVSLKTEFKQKWITKLDEIIAESNKNKEELNQEIKTSEEDETYQKVSKSFEESTQLKELEEKIKIQKNKLSEVNTLSAEITELTLQKNRIKNDIIDAHKQFFEKINEILPQLSYSKDDLEIKAKSKFNLSDYRDMLYQGLHQKSQNNETISKFGNGFLLTLKKSMI